GGRGGGGRQGRGHAQRCRTPVGRGTRRCNAADRAPAAPSIWWRRRGGVCRRRSLRVPLCQLRVTARFGLARLHGRRCWGPAVDRGHRLPVRALLRSIPPRSKIARSSPPMIIRLVPAVPLALAAGSPALAAYCGCDKPPPTPNVSVRPDFSYPGATIILFSENFVNGRYYTVNFYRFQLSATLRLYPRL